MPQFIMGDFAPQIVWLVISFVALYLLMARVALPRVADVLETRHGRIADDLDQAAQLKSQAETVIVEYEEALATLEAAQAAEKRNAEIAEALAAEAAAAASRIDAAKAEALAELRGVAAELALAAAERLLVAQVAQADVDAAVDAAMTNEKTGA